MARWDPATVDVSREVGAVGGGGQASGAVLERQVRLQEHSVVDQYPTVGHPNEFTRKTDHSLDEIVHPARALWSLKDHQVAPVHVM